MNQRAVLLICPWVLINNITFYLNWRNIWYKCCIATIPLNHYNVHGHGISIGTNVFKNGWNGSRRKHKMHWEQSNNYHQDDYCEKERPSIERCHPCEYLSRNTLWPRSLFHRLWRQNNIWSIRWRVLIRFDKASWQGASISERPGPGDPPLPSWQPANKYHQQERRRGARGPGGHTIDHRAMCPLASPQLFATLNRVQLCCKNIIRHSALSLNIKLVIPRWRAELL